MKLKEFTSLSGLLLFLFSLGASDAFSQKWGGLNGNEWLNGKYGQQWVRIGVSAKGIFRVNVSDLPAAFQAADKKKLELWHRGAQVSLIKADSTEILFYGVPNDGALDSLIYRPASTRKNPYYSIFSDESSYFLTINPSVNGNRAVAPMPVSNSPVAVTSHLRSDVRIYNNEYSHSTLNAYRPPTYNSYYDDGKQRTGTSLMGSFLGANIQTSNPVSSLNPGTYVPEPFSFQVKYPVGTGAKRISVHLKGRLGASIAEIYVGKTAATLRSVGTVNITDMNDYDYAFDLLDTDIDANGNGTLGFKTTQVGYAGSGYSVSHFTLTYAQALNMQNLNTYEFDLQAVPAGQQSSVAIAGAPANVKVYDIANVDVPRVLTSSPASFLIDRNGQKLKLLATNVVTTVPAANITTTTFNQITPASYDYLIVCSNTLTSSANAYATYRQTTSPGKKFNPIVINIRDVYNQFNYGEPSPVAIRRFVDFMISDGQKANKYLLLVGRSNNFVERMTREIPDEVPTVGFPGSDLLLTDGLGGTPEDVPAIPVGRIAAINNQQVLDYLAKVQKYESQTNLAWRRNVVHISGGKTPWEIGLYAEYLNAIATVVTGSPFSGTVVSKVKTVATSSVVEMNFAAELNGTGVGMMSYFGHGNVDRTDYNPGYVTDPAKGYNNPDNFPVLFYNGCGVNNVFSGRNGLFGTSPSTSVRPVSLDWLLAPNKGAIIVFGNSWESFAGVSNEYLARLYPEIFSKSDNDRGTMGQILQNVAVQTKLEKGYTYSGEAFYYDANRANIHQILLQGDPALKILVNEAPLSMRLAALDAEAAGEKVNVTWKIASENSSSQFVVERSHNGRDFEEFRSEDIRAVGESGSDPEISYTLTDPKPFAGKNYYRLKQVDFTSADRSSATKSERLSRVVLVEFDRTSAMSVSPNPSSDYFEIRLDVPSRISKWKLINANGRVAKDNGTGSGVDLSDLSPGEYILEVATTDGDKFTKKVVKL
ncbi:putative type IX secretion system sortase PorU2 [Dyadobacter jiangsuensis]